MNLNAPITGNAELDAYLFAVRTDIQDLIYLIDQQKINSYNGTFTVDGKTITVVNGIITNVV